MVPRICSVSQDRTIGGEHIPTNYLPFSGAAGELSSISHLYEAIYQLVIEMSHACNDDEFNVISLVRYDLIRRCPVRTQGLMLIPKIPMTLTDHKEQ